MFVIVALAIFALAIAVSKLAMKDDGQRGAHANAERALLVGEGLELKGDPADEYELSGTAHGVRMQVKNRASETTPGVTANKSQSVCIIRFDVALVDQIVCPLSDADSVMGPLPSSPRVRTELAAFDNAYAAFLQKGQDESAYRGGETHAVLGGVPNAILERLLELDLRWARVKEGKCELAFAPLEAADVVRAVRVAARIANGKDEPKLTIDSGAKRAPRDDFRSLSGLSVGVTWFLSFVAAIVVTPLLAPALSLFKEPGGRIFCDGSALVYTSSSHKYIQCANDPARGLFVYYFVCFLIILGLMITVFLGTAKLKAMSK